MFGHIYIHIQKFIPYSTDSYSSSSKNTESLKVLVYLAHYVLLYWELELKPSTGSAVDQIEENANSQKKSMIAKKLTL